MFTSLKFVQKSILVLFTFVLPMAASAAAFPDPLPTVRSVGLQTSVQIGGMPVKLPVTVAAGTDFTIVWHSTGTGCVSNWSAEVLPASGSSVGSITSSRPFLITCFGRGAGQSSTMQVNVGVTDIAVSSFSLIGLKRAKASGTYVEGPFTVKATLRNLGKLLTTTTFKVKYTLANSPDMKTGLITMGEIAVSGIGGGVSKPLDDFPWTATPSGEKSIYYQICADTGSAVAEADETNNCSKVLGPFKFVAKTP